MAHHHVLPSYCEAMEEEVGDSCSLEDWRIPASHHASPPVGSCGGAPPQPPAPLPLQRKATGSPLVLPLPYSYSSSALSKLSPLEENSEPTTPPCQLSPALQASVAAWQSANCLLQELQVLQDNFQLTGQPAAAAAAAADLLLLSTPAQQFDAQQLPPLQQPEWLQAAVLQQQMLQQGQQQGHLKEACSPLYQSAVTHSDAPTATQQPHHCH